MLSVGLMVDSNGPQLFKDLHAAAPAAKLFAPEGMATASFSTELPARGKRFYADFTAEYGEPAGEVDSRRRLRVPSRRWRLPRRRPAPALFLGVGAGAAFPALMTVAMAGVPPEDSGLASGIVNSNTQVGGPAR